MNSNTLSHTDNIPTAYLQELLLYEGKLLCVATEPSDSQCDFLLCYLDHYKTIYHMFHNGQLMLDRVYHNT